MSEAAAASPGGAHTHSRSFRPSRSARWPASSQRAARRPKLWSPSARSRKQPSAARATRARTAPTLNQAQRFRLSAVSERAWSTSSVTAQIFAPVKESPSMESVQCLLCAALAIQAAAERRKTVQGSIARGMCSCRVSSWRRG